MLGTDEIVYSIHGGGEQNRMTLEAGLVSQSAGQMGFPQTHPAHKDHVASVFNELQPEQILYLDLVDFFGPGPVELIQGFDNREPCGFHPAGDDAVLAKIGFLPDELGEKVDVGPLVPGGRLSHGFMMFPDIGQFQVV